MPELEASCLERQTHEDALWCLYVHVFCNVSGVQSQTGSSSGLVKKCGERESSLARSGGKLP